MWITTKQLLYLFSEECCFLPFLTAIPKHLARPSSNSTFLKPYLIFFSLLQSKLITPFLQCLAHLSVSRFLLGYIQLVVDLCRSLYHKHGQNRDHFCLFSHPIQCLYAWCIITESKLAKEYKTYHSETILEVVLNSWQGHLSYIRLFLY